jgi:hypothetical protein
VVVFNRENTREPLFVEAATWPIEPASLAALIGVGLTDRQIAAYFTVGVAEVEALRERFGLR